MKIRTGLLLIIAALLLSNDTFGAQTPVTFTSYSVYIPPARAEDPLTELEWMLSFGSVPSESSINHELALATSDHGFSHETWYFLEDPFFADVMILQAFLDIPPYDDANNNGIDDFYDPAAEINFVETIGFHAGENGGEPFSATWVRTAGETVGTVTIDLPSFDLQFTHQFQLFQYKGTYSYDRNGKILQGTMAVTNVLVAEDIIQGPLTVEVVSTNELKLSADRWNNGAGTDFVVTTNFFDGRLLTNFLSYWVLEDGMPINGVTDYVDWMMILSSSDANGNGVLDLVETGGSPTQRPTIGIRRTDAGFEVTVTGAVGKSYKLEETTLVEDTAWPNHTVITLTSSTQTFTVPAGTGAIRFFRLVEI